MPYSLLAAITTGLLLGIGYQFLGVLGFVAYAPLLVYIGGRLSVSRWSYFLVLYTTFFVYHAGTNWWVCSWQERTDPYLFASGIALAVAHPIFLSIPFYLLASIRQRVGPIAMLMVAPFCITGFEWLHGQTDASYPWLSVGYMLTDLPWGQLAEYVGVYGLSFLIAAVNAALSYWWIRRRTEKSTYTIPIAVAASLVILAVLGAYRKAMFKADLNSQGLLVTIVQPNLDPWDKWMDGWTNVALHEHIIDSARAIHPNISHSLVVWPETAIPFTIRRSTRRADWTRLRSWVDTSCSALLTGYADYVVYADGEAPTSAKRSRVNPNVQYDIFNAATIIPSRSAAQSPSAPSSDHNLGVHRKSMLTPFAERMPFADQLSFATTWIEWGVGISAWGKGTTREPLVYRDTVKVAPIICIESIYPEVARDMVRAGATVLCVITNDAWYNGTWGPQQHYTIAQMRAIEQRRPLIRCAMSGVSGFIAADGTTYTDLASTLAPMQRGILMGRVQPREYPTLYSVIGDPWSPLWLIVSIAAFISTRFRRLIRKLHIRFPTIITQPHS